MFDAAPIVITELANAPDWLPFVILLNGERFSLASGTVEAYRRTLDLRNGLLSRTVRWRSPYGLAATLAFQRFASWPTHILCIRCQAIPEFEGRLEFRLAINGNTDNEGLAHWRWLEQEYRDGIVILLNETRHTGIQAASAMRLAVSAGQAIYEAFWDAENTPTLVAAFDASRPAGYGGQAGGCGDFPGYRSSGGSRHRAGAEHRRLRGRPGSQPSRLGAGVERTDVLIEGDDEAQISIRFNLFQLLPPPRARMTG